MTINLTIWNGSGQPVSTNVATISLIVSIIYINSSVLLQYKHICKHRYMPYATLCPQHSITSANFYCKHKQTGRKKLGLEMSDCRWKKMCKIWVHATNSGIHRILINSISIYFSVPLSHIRFHSNKYKLFHCYVILFIVFLIYHRHYFTMKSFIYANFFVRLICFKTALFKTDSMSLTFIVNWRLDETNLLLMCWTMPKIYTFGT